MKGVKCRYVFDEEYFKVGDVFRLHKKGTNGGYANVIVSSVDLGKVVFSCLDSTIKITIEDSVNWEIVKLSPDFENGLFEFEE